MEKYRVRASYTFQGWFDVLANSPEEAKEKVLEHCSTTLNPIQTTLPDDEVQWEFQVHPEMEAYTIKKRKK